MEDHHIRESAKPSTAQDGIVAKSWISTLYSHLQTWKSKISRRVATTVFTTILLVQTTALAVTIPSYKYDLLENLEKTAVTSFVSLLNSEKNPHISPLSPNNAEKLFHNTNIRGIAIYTTDSNLIEVYGEKPDLDMKPGAAFPEDSQTKDGKYYEVPLRADEIVLPYNVILKIDSSKIRGYISNYLLDSFLTFLLLSGFVTCMLMIAISLWVLEPVLFLRNNLLAAARNPENPDISSMKKDSNDEISIAIRIANDLIRQNASNLKRLKIQTEDKIHKLAYYDALTGLPNRTYFIEKLDEKIKTRVTAGDARLAVISVDLDHFKDINDTMGHEIGDKLLDAFGKRLVKSLPEGVLVSRASADEFTVMISLDDTLTDSSIFVERIFSSMIEPISIHPERFQMRVSIGVTHCPEDGMEARQILKNADIALNRAKEEGRDTVRYYSRDLDNVIQHRFQLLRDLRVAMDQKRLELYYHPQFDLKTGCLIGAEALLRWWVPDNSKEGGRFISPAEFIPIAEQSGLIVPIGEYVLKAAIAANKRWQAKGLPPIRIAVNISGVQFYKGDIVDLVSSAIKEEKFDPHLLELELTESVFMENVQASIETLNKLHRLGVELSVDDFGTGYSSLSYLRQFPIDRLKIDQSFIRNALNNTDDRAITKTIIMLGHSLDLKVIAEGVETAEHEAFLKEEGCDEVQGFKYTVPIPEDKFFEFAIAHNRALVKSEGLKVVDKKA